MGSTDEAHELASVLGDRDPDECELSIVMPCLNEVETVGTCIDKAMSFLRQHNVCGEVVVADNGSTDGSQDVARKAGARVVDVPGKGYGNALMGGFDQARGRFLIMGDADDSYDFLVLMPFLEKLRAGYDLVMGNRFKGGIKPGAMPWLHRYIGNPILTCILNVLYRSGIGDAHCGLRGLTKQAYESLSLRTTGMEFASEMIVKADARGLRMCEVPTVLSPDGRSRPPHLRSFRDGWRHLRFLVLLSPKWCLMIPGAILMAVGVLLAVAVLTGPLQVQGVVLGVHTLVGASLMVIVGYQSITIGIAARIYAVQEEIGPPSALLQDSFKIFTLERGMTVGAIVLGLGLFAICSLLVRWVVAGMGPLDLQTTVRPMIAGTTLVVVGVQTILMSLFYSMLGIARKRIAT